MKKLFGLLVLVLLTGLLATTAFAASCNPSEAYAGNKVIVDGFYDDNGDYCSDLGRSYLSEYYRVSASGALTATYVSKCGIDEDGEVYIIINPDLSSTREKKLTGTITLREIGGNKAIYRAVIEEGDLVVNPGGKDLSSSISSLGNGDYALPYDYQTSKVSFTGDDGKSQGNLRFDFEGLAYFNARFASQKELFLGFHTSTNTGLTSKYPDAALSFIAWTAKPKFDVGGTLGIMAHSDEYVYEITSDGTLKNVSAKYNANTGAFEFSTNTLGSYVVSSQKLPTTAGTASSAASSAASSVAPPPSSSAPASSSQPVENSSSTVPESSSQPEESSSQPEPPRSSASSEPSEPTDVPANAEKSGLPLVPILIGVLVVLAAAILLIFLGGKKKSKPKFEDWDE